MSMSMGTSAPHVVMPLSNAYQPDPRVEREAQALAAAGHRVSIIAWDRQAKLAPREQRGGVEVIRVQGVHSVHGAGWRQLFHLPRFWRESIRMALALRPDVMHCHDLDTLYIGWQVKRRLGCRLIYDSHEHYPAVMSLYLPAPLIKALALWERWLMRHVDATITASTLLRDEFRERSARPVVTLGNYQELPAYAAVTADEVAALRRELGAAAEDLLVAYIGALPRDRMLLPLIAAAALLPDVGVHLWGDGLQRAEVERATAAHPNAQYHGWLAAHDLPRHFRAMDIIYYCLRADYPGAVYNAPNSLSHAMLSGRPIIANAVGDLGRIVRTTNCGLVIDETTPESIAAAITALRDPARRAELGGNGLAAARQTYNAESMQQELLRLYGEVLGR